jgi:hypothetical protein
MRQTRFKYYFKEVEAAKYFLPAGEIAMAGMKNSQGYQGTT